MRIKLIITIILLMRISSFSQNDSVVFSSEKVGLIIFTQNVDSIKYHSDQAPPNPFSPTMTTYSVRINTYDTAELVIKFKNHLEKTLVIFKWDKVSPGSYQFDWWEYIKNIPSGMYYTEKIINDKSEIKRVLLVK